MRFGRAFFQDVYACLCVATYTRVRAHVCVCMCHVSVTRAINHGDDAEGCSGRAQKEKNKKTGTASDGDVRARRWYPRWTGMKGALTLQAGHVLNASWGLRYSATASGADTDAGATRLST